MLSLQQGAYQSDVWRVLEEELPSFLGARHYKPPRFTLLLVLRALRTRKPIHGQAAVLLHKLPMFAARSFPVPRDCCWHFTRLSSRHRIEIQ